MGELKIKKKIMIIAGEASGDKHGAKLVMAMKEKRDDLFFCGIGGEALQAAGVKIIVHASQLCVVGITEVFSKIPSILKGLAAARRLIQTLEPDLLILIDFPDFNLHVAGAAKKNGIPVLYYISPQIWAWRKGRIKKIGELVDHMALILPFEERYYKKYAIPASFVGHPLLDDNSPGNKSGFQKEPDLVLGILPGSRNSEIIRHLPVMLDAADLLSAKNRDLKVIVSVAGTVDKSLVNRIFGDYKGNTTRFLILSKENIVPIYNKDTSYITSLVFNVRNVPSFLYKALGGFATNGINLIKLESYSMTGSMDASQFHADIDGHTDEKRLQLALEELRFFANEVKVLGVYKRNSYRDKMKTFEI
ncbi:MAG TPA: lipid-A-disaccharide synthase, partial [Desulfobacteraceae bacterium]|nr:lipid-A-disaccharide synthase [Desulfobacteraceae bacterium]